MHELLKSSGLPATGVPESLEGFPVADFSGVAGTIGIERSGKAVLLRSLAVRPDCRKSGIAAELVERSLEMARETGAREAYLLTSTADKYMQRWGFQYIERSRIPADLLKRSDLEAACCPVSSSCMKLEL